MKISACVIVKNEEHNIGRWLDNMLKLADDIVVVDTGSQDCTVDLVRERGIEPYYFEWCNDFAVAKNYAISKAKGDWILFLDADEYFDEQSIMAFSAVMQKYHRKKEIGAILCRLIDIDSDNKNMVRGGMLQVRIFRNVPQIAYVGAIHERLQVLEGNFVMQYCKTFVIYHTGYSSSIVKQKAARNLAILLEKEKENADGKYGNLDLYIADAYFALAKYEESFEYARKAVKANIGSLGNPGHAYKNLIAAMVGLGKPVEEIMAVLDEAVEKFPACVFFMVEKGHYYYVTKDYMAAIHWYEKAVALHEKQEAAIKSGEQSMDEAISVMPVLYGDMADIFLLRRKKQQALEYVLKGLECNKYNRLLICSLYKALADKPIADIIQIFACLFNRKEDGAYLVDTLKGIAAKEFAAYYGAFSAGGDRINTFLLTHNYSGAAVVSRQRLRIWQHLLMAAASDVGNGDMLRLLPSFYRGLSSDCSKWNADDDLQAVRRLLDSRNKIVTK